MKTLYLLVGSIGSGKSTIGSAIFSSSGIEYIGSDCYKKLFFDSWGDNLHQGYRKADMLVEYKMEKVCKESADFLHEICPTNQEKINKMKSIIEKYDYKVISFFIGTSDVKINIARTRNRYYNDGSDPVAEEKVRSRYFDTMNNIFQIIEISDIIYFIDSSIGIEKIACLENNNLHIFNHTDWLDNFVLNKINKQ